MVGKQKKMKRKLKEFAKTHDENTIDEIRKYSKYAQLNKKRDHDEWLLLLEGKILIEEVLKLNKSIVGLKRIFHVGRNAEWSKMFENLNIPREKASQIDQNLMSLISDVKTNQGIAGYSFISFSY